MTQLVTTDVLHVRRWEDWEQLHLSRGSFCKRGLQGLLQPSSNLRGWKMSAKKLLKLLLEACSKSKSIPVSTKNGYWTWPLCGPHNGPHEAPYAQRLDLGWVVIGDVCLGQAHKPASVTVYKTNLLLNGRSSFLSPCSNSIHVKETCLPLHVSQAIFINTVITN